MEPGLRGTVKARVFVGVRAGWLDAPEVGYYGLGPDSVAEDRANFGVEQGYGGLTLTFRPSPWFTLGGDVAYEDFTTQEGAGSAPGLKRSMRDTAPGLFSNPPYIHSQAEAAIDWRPSPGYARSGGFYSLTFHDYTDRDDTYSFRRVDGEIVQHMPMLRENWVISLRGRVQTTLGDDDIVPYSCCRTLGSGSTLRGYTSGRFRDRHSLLTSAEFRWIPNRLGMDMALFYDAGKVAPRLTTSTSTVDGRLGIGVRFHGPTATVAAHRDGKRIRGLAAGLRRHSAF